jgi:hypothetical protein
MGIELGRISGPLLTANLLRDGIDLAFENDLLYLNVIDGRIGVNTDAPSHLLQVANNLRSTNFKVDTLSTFPELRIATNRIYNPVDGSIYFAPAGPNPIVDVGGLGVQHLRIRDGSLLENITNNNDFVFSPYTTSDFVNFYTNSVEIFGNLHATGDITWDGDITLGTSADDSVSFVAEIASDIVPDLTNEYTIGNSDKRWSDLYSIQINGQLTTANSLVPSDIDMLLRQGNTYYVSVNGNDSYVGNHLHATFRSVKQALSVAVSGDEIVIFPGAYQEIFPLTVPSGVTVRGAGIRSVSIEPTLATNDKDAFLLNNASTVEFLTVKNFYYNATDNTGYGFRLASGARSYSRSPYIQNITVITKGSVTSLSDPNGFLSGDAGRGALVDGAVANGSRVTSDWSGYTADDDSDLTVDGGPPDIVSGDSAMLFQAVTFITHGADGLTLTNGVRAEWLNCFTYFANRGIYLTQGTAGLAGLGIEFATELRSIGSANVYGNYGVVAEGADVLAYLVGHNFGYIGAADDSNNDYGLVIQANEVVALLDANIYYDSMDHKGDYRVGNIFYVNQETGQVSFDAQAINFGANGSVVFEGGNGVTSITATEVRAGYIQFKDNTISSLQGPVNILAFNGSTTLNTNVDITGNLAVTGSFAVDGNIFLGDNPLDLVTVFPNLTQTIKPKDNATFTLGTTGVGVNEKRWRDLYFAGLTDFGGNIVAGSIDSLTGYFEVPNIKIEDGVVSVTAADTDLIITANGTGSVLVDNLKITDTTIFNNWSSPTTNTQRSIILTPNGTGSTIINTNTSLVIPYGNNASYPMTITGEIRHNSTTNLYEGYQPSGLVSFFQLYDNDRNTSITPELVPNANDHILRFTTNNKLRMQARATHATLRAVFDSGGTTFDAKSTMFTELSTAGQVLTTPTIIIDGATDITATNFKSVDSSNDLYITPDGSGVSLFTQEETFDNDTTIFDSGITTFKTITAPISGNSIANANNYALILSNTGIGYWRIGGAAVAVPYGDDLTRNTVPEVGTTRYNTDPTRTYLEVYSGATNGWIPAIGSSGPIQESEVYDIMDEWTLILG